MVLVAGHAQTYRSGLPHDELAFLQRGPEAARLAAGLVDPETEWLASPSGKRGRSATFTDAAIQACLTLKALLGLALRQTTGLVASLLELARAGLQHALLPSKGLERGHPLPSRHRRAAPLDR